MSDLYFEEEEFTTQFNGSTLLRILSQTKPHWRWVAGFMVAITIVAFIDAYTTFLSKRIIDEGIIAQNKQALIHIVTLYGSVILIQSVTVFIMIYLTGVLVSACATICANACSTTCRTYRSRITAAPPWVGSCHALPPIPNASPIC